MSGVEFLAVIGGISAILSTADAIMDIYKSVKDIQGLPEAFSMVAGRLLIVKVILESTKRHIENVNDESLCKGIRQIVEQCETNAGALKSMFAELKPDDSAWRVELYFKAVEARGTGHKVETLMANILKDIQLLDSQRGMKTVAEEQRKEILAAIKELSQVQPSVPDGEFYAQDLEEYKTIEVENAIDLFPSGLEELYDPFLSGLEELYAGMLLQIPHDRREIVARKLLWVAMAIRPLTLAQLSVAIDVNTSGNFTQFEVMRDQISYCGCFLIIKDDDVILLHRSARDYLLRKTADPNPLLDFFRVKKRLQTLRLQENA